VVLATSAVLFGVALVSILDVFGRAYNPAASIFVLALVAFDQSTKARNGSPNRLSDSTSIAHPFVRDVP